MAADLSAGLHWRFWAPVPLVGVTTGLAAGLLMRLLRGVQQLAWPAAGADFLQHVRSAGAAHCVLIVLAAGMIVALLRWRSGRSTGGHGAELTQLIWFHAGRIPVTRITVRAVLSIVIVGMGAALGREAAAKQIGALLASIGAQWRGLSPGDRHLLACGTGAGIGAICNVPFGGALFALEVLLGLRTADLLRGCTQAALRRAAAARPAAGVRHARCAGDSIAGAARQRQGRRAGGAAGPYALANDAAAHGTAAAGDGPVAATQGPVSAIVLTLELTRRIDPLMVPLMPAVASATLTCASLERRSIYSGRIHAARQRARQAQATAQRTDDAADASVVSAAMRYRELLRTLLRQPPGTSLRVLDESGLVIGEIDRERVCYPHADDGPLQTATAAEFLREPVALSQRRAPPAQ